MFVKVETDDGLVGWGECSDSRSPLRDRGRGARHRGPPDRAGSAAGRAPVLGHAAADARRTSGGVTHKAIAGVELALWDIKAQALGVPVYELFGGPLRDRIRLYWSHCGTTRARAR